MPSGNSKEKAKVIRKGETDAIWDAATAEFYDSGVPDTDRSYVNRVVNALRKLKGVTPAEIHRRAAALKAEWGEKHGTICTLRALVRNWDQFPPPKRRLRAGEGPEVEIESWQNGEGRWHARNKPK